MYVVSVSFVLGYCRVTTLSLHVFSCLVGVAVSPVSLVRLVRVLVVSALPFLYPSVVLVALVVDSVVAPVVLAVVGFVVAAVVGWSRFVVGLCLVVGSAAVVAVAAVVALLL